MPRSLWLVLAALLAFVAIVLVRLPAAWALALLPAGAGIDCTGPGGSVWSGRCERLAVRGAELGTLAWTLRPAALLRGKLAGAASARHPPAALDCEFESDFDGEHLSARRLRGELPLDPALVPQLPSNLRGRITVDLAMLRLERGRVVAIAGRLEGRDLRQAGVRTLELGNYELLFDRPPLPDGSIEGRLRDRGGPFAVEGTLRLTPEPGYVLEGRVAPTGATPPEVARQLAYLGSPDAAGRRPFSLAGTF